MSLEMTRSTSASRVFNDVETVIPELIKAKDEINTYINLWNDAIRGGVGDTPEAKKSFDQVVILAGRGEALMKEYHAKAFSSLQEVIKSDPNSIKAKQLAKLTQIFLAGQQYYHTLYWSPPYKLNLQGVIILSILTAGGTSLTIDTIARTVKDNYPLNYGGLAIGVASVALGVFLSWMTASSVHIDIEKSLPGLHFNTLLGKNT